MDDEMDVLCHKVFGDRYHIADLLDDQIHDLLGDNTISDLLGGPLHDLLDDPRANNESQDLSHHEARDEPNDPLFDRVMRRAETRV